jgi:TRAP-type C4-dicarboxylate transport system permease small subunit
MYIHYHSLWNGGIFACWFLLIGAPSYFAFFVVAVSLGTDYARYRYRAHLDDLPRHFLYVAILQSFAMLILYILLRLLIWEKI